MRVSESMSSVLMHSAKEFCTPRLLLASTLGTLMLLVAGEAGWVTLTTLYMSRIDDMFLIPAGWTCLISGLVCVVALLVLTKFKVQAEHVIPMVVVTWLVTNLLKVGVLAVIPDWRPYVVVRTSDNNGFVRSDEIYSRSSPVVRKLQGKKSLKNVDGSSTYIERRSFSWRYELLLGCSLGEDGSMDAATYEVFGWRKLFFGIRIVAENSVWTALTAGIPFMVLCWAYSVATKESFIPRAFVNALASSNKHLLACCIGVMGIIALGLCD